jgi:hypothetical protein
MAHFGSPPPPPVLLEIKIFESRVAQQCGAWILRAVWPNNMVRAFFSACSAQQCGAWFFESRVAQQYGACIF